MTYKSKVNQYTGKLQNVFDGSLVTIKEAVATYNDLPITGNTESDLRIVQDTDRMYTWGISASSGALSDWIDVGSTTSIAWGNLTGTLANQTDLQSALDGKIDNATLSNVDNTSDANKPVSTAQQTEIDTKLDKTSATVTSSLHSTSPQIITFPVDDTFNFNDKNFTIEMFVYFSAISGEMIFYEHNATTYPLRFYYSSHNNRLEFLHRGNIWYTPTFPFVTGTWYHIAVSREQTWLKVFIDGTERSGAGDYSNVQQANDSVTCFNIFDGYVSNLRVSNNRRYGVNFPVPTKDFVLDANTLLLIKGSNPIIDETGKELTTVTVTHNTTEAPFVQDAIVTVDENGNPSSSDVSLSTVKDLRLNKHVPNTDTILAEGEDDEVSANELRTHVDSTSNPHGVDASDVGLGNVDNTADTAKPVSTAQQTAIDAKLNKKIDSTPDSDHTVKGISSDFTAGESLVFGDVCYIKSDGKMWKGDADAEATAGVVAMAIGTISADASGEFLLIGIARDDSWAWTVGGFIYLDVTAGAISQTAPSGSGDIVQILGLATHADRIYFKPELVQIEVS